MKSVSELLGKRSSILWHIRPDDSVFDALKLLADHEVGALMVMDQGRLVGIMSERDYTRKIALQGKNSRETRVSEIMTKNVLVVSPKTRTRECMALMSEKKIRLMDDIIADHELTIAQLESYIHN
jgi:CBS domain-containing protein